MSKIHFFLEDVSYEFHHKPQIIRWLNAIAEKENYAIEEINYILCSDEYLLKINQQYLNHDYYTDIITFDHSDTLGKITSDIFISLDRVKENAKGLNIPDRDELLRVMAHGLLHLLGYMDKTPDEKILMRQKEDTCLSLLK